MKYLPLLLLTLAAVGCGHNEFDVSPAQAKRHKSVSAPGGLTPLGSRVDETKTHFKKGDRLPDGTNADRDVNMVIASDDKGDAGK